MGKLLNIFLLVFVVFVLIVRFAEAGEIHEASRRGDLATVKKLVEEGADINETDKDGNTPLHVAAAKGYMEIVRYLTEYKANPKTQDKPAYVQVKPKDEKTVQLALRGAITMEASFLTHFIGVVSTDGGKQILLKMALRNYKKDPYSLEQEKQIQIKVRPTGGGDEKMLNVAGFFIHPFSMPDGVKIENTIRWLSWYNVEDPENPDCGTHVYFPSKHTHVTLPGESEIELSVLCAVPADYEQVVISFPGCQPLSFDKGIVQAWDKWIAGIRAEYGNRGAKHFIPRKADNPIAVTEDGLPVLSIWGKKWRAKKGGSGKGLVVFRAVSSKVIPCGGAGDLATEIAW